MADTIRMAHGSGGSATSRLIEEVFYKAFGGDPMSANDSAVIDMPAGKVAFTTDAFVVSPLFFPGGDIGKLAFCGTVNDLASVGARPVAITASFIIEEGVEIAELGRIAESMGEVSRKTGIPVVAGDTKVVDKGSADKIFITTSGIGVIPDDIEYHPRNIKEGDKIIISGSIGDHAYCITALREGIDIQSNIKSDCAPLNKLVEALRPFGKDIRAIRDATRGGVGMVLNEWAQQSDNEIMVREEDFPIKDEVRGGCALLGLDPLYLANEGKMIFAVSAGCEEAVVNALKSDDAGTDAAVMGEVLVAPSSRKRVIAETSWGTKRIIPVPRGEILPRIC